MKRAGLKILSFFMAFIFLFPALSGCGGEKITPLSPKMPPEGPSGLTDRELLAYEAEKSFDFLWEQASVSRYGYGLVRDKYPDAKNLCSIAATGFALASLPVAVKNGWVKKENALKRAEGTLKCFLELENHGGFFYHFYLGDTGDPAPGSEVSVIDTALFTAGAVVAGEFFGGNAKKLADEIYGRIDWNFFTKTLADGRKLFYMAYNAPLNSFSGAWDMYAEQLLMYVLGAGAKDPLKRADRRMFYDFKRPKAGYGGGNPFVYSYFGSVFTYQYSHAFIDFRGMEDEEGTDWFQNSVDASLAAKNYCADNADKYLTYGKDSWGLTACSVRGISRSDGYNGRLGAQPSGFKNEALQSEGTIAPAGALGSVVFTPEESLAALRRYYSYDKLRSRYGLLDAYNLGKKPGEEWYAENVLGIDKGITVLMAGNYVNGGIVWKYFMKNENVKDALKRLGFEKR